MNTTPELLATIIVSSCGRSEHLERCLLSFSNQQLHESERFEVIVADDGSRDGTREMVRHLAGHMPFHLSFVTQTNNGFRKCRIVNRAISTARSDYILFTDGDCIFPPDHVKKQLSHRQRDTAWVSDCIRLEQSLSETITRNSVINGSWLNSVPANLPASLRIRYLKDKVYEFLNDNEKPKLIGNNVAVWLQDLKNINGMDEAFKGWGCEDDDLGIRLRASGIKLKTNMQQTFGYHLWHPVDATTPSTWREGKNISYYQRDLVLAKCLRGLVKRDLGDLNYRINASPRHQKLAALLKQSFTRKSPNNIDIEILLGNCQTQENSDAEKTIEVWHADEMPQHKSNSPNLLLILPNCETTSVASQLALRNSSEDMQPSVERQLNWLIKQISDAVLGGNSVTSAANLRIAA